MKPKGETGALLFYYCLLACVHTVGSWFVLTVNIYKAAFHICLDEYIHLCHVFILSFQCAFIFQVFENGKVTGETSIYISKKDLRSNKPTQSGDMMQRVSLLLIPDYKCFLLLIAILNNYILRCSQKSNHLLICKLHFS